MAKAQLREANEVEKFEHTRERIYAYLHALKPLSGNCISEEYQRGREIIAILAETSEGYDYPKRELTLDECADVVAFMHLSEPRDRRTFLTEPRGQPSMECGYHIVLSAVEDSLRSLRVPMTRTQQIAAAARSVTKRLRSERDGSKLHPLKTRPR